MIADHPVDPLTVPLFHREARMAAAPEALELPFDRPRPAARVWQGGRLPLALPPELSGEGADLVPRLLAGFLALLHRYTGQEEIALVISGDGASRVRADLSGDPSFRELAGRARAIPAGEALEPDLALLLAGPEDAPEAFFEYDRGLFDAVTILRLAGHFERLLAEAAAHPERRLSELSLAGEAERHQLLQEWNDTRAAGPAPALLHTRFEAQAARTPDALALAAGERRLTYRELDAEASGLAGRLRRLGVGPEVRVGVFLERSAEIVVALLGILKAGGAYVPLDPAYPRERVAFMLADSGAAGVVTRDRLREAMPGHEGWTVCLDDGAAGSSSGEMPPTVSAGNLAYLIYTSGSTGRPKAVAIRHGSAAVLVEWAADVFPPEDLVCVLASTSICFDLSVFELFVPLSRGGRVVLAPDALALPSLAGQGVTLLNTVPSAAAELVRTGGLPSSVTTVNLAGEALLRPLVDDLYRQPHVRRVFNLYGPSEDTTYSTFTLVDRDDPRPPSIGRPLRDTRAYVVDGRLRPAPLGVAGELLLGGEGLARGYLGRPDLTAEKFIPDPFSGEPGARLYRTGDLARFLPDGSLSFLGRLDHQVKIRGFRIELAEVEAALNRHPHVRESVAVAREDTPGDKRLVAYVAAEGTAGELRAFLRQSLPEHMLPSAFVFLPALPRTLNGKVDRRALPAPATGRNGEGTAPRGPVEELLAGFWSEVLGIGGIGAEDHFFELGGHSLLGSRVLSRVRDAFGVELPLSTLFHHPTLAGLAVAVEESRRRSSGLAAPPLRPVPRQGRLPMSFAQQRLWFVDQAYPGLTAYSIPAAFDLEGPLDVPALEAALNEIVRRHEALRTRLDQGPEGPYQEVDPPRPLPLPRIDLAAVPRPEEELRRIGLAEAGRPFDLARGPVLRAVLARLEDGRHTLLLTVHHVAADGWSLDVFQRELEALLGASAQGRLPDLPVQYADFAVWQRQWLQGEVMEAQLCYWRDRLAGAPAVLELPADRPRPAVQSFRGRTLGSTLPAVLRERLLDVGQRRGATPFMTFFAGFLALLHRYTGQDDLVVGSVAANRNRSELEGLIGFFANTLALRTRLSGEPTFEDLLDRVRETALGAYAHQDLPFERLVEELHPQRDLSRNPIVQVLFQLLPPPPSSGSLPRIRQVEREHGTAKFDFYLYLTETGEGGLEARLESSRDLFDAATAARLLAHYEALAGAAAAFPGRRLADLPLLTEAERHQAQREWNDTGFGAPAGEVPVHERIEEQARRTPDAVALEAGEITVTYRELAARANRLAHHLQALGVGPEERVGIFLERSPEMMISLLAVLKAGGAYVPLDPAYPRERVALTLADAEARAVVTQESLLPLLPATPARIVAIDRDRAAIEARSAEPPPRTVSPENLAYLIYTSGSTGRPKGVAVRHRSVSVLLEWGARAFTAEELECSLASTSISFDVSVFEIFAPLSRGGRLVIVRDALALPSEAAGRKVTLICTVPSAMAELVRLGAVPDSVLTVGLGGEAFPGSLAEDLHRRTAVRRVLNLYGPSEDTTYSTIARIEAGAPGEPSIGRPVAETRAYVLDRWMRELPLGAPGELYLGGEGLARGYLGRPGLTAEKLIPDPLSGQPGRRLYRTGDLVRRLPDGSLRFLGRLDHQVKIRGHRVELGEIEAALARLPGVKASAVVAREDTPGLPRLVAYAVLEEGRALTAAQLRDHLGRTLPGPMIPSAFVFLGALPLTPNGKVDRKALPAPESDRTLDSAFVRPRGPVEELVAGIWSELLGIDEIGVHDDFFDLGGHSLLATQAVSRLRERFQVELPIRTLFARPTVAALAELLGSGDRSGAERGLPPILPAGGGPEVPLSFGQQRLLLLERMSPGNPAYNLPTGFRLSGPLDVAALEQAFSEIVRRHEVLRTVFPGGMGEILPPAGFRLPCADLRALPPEIRGAEVERLSLLEARIPFNLSEGPVLRATLLRLEDAGHALLLNLHHIAGDAWSLSVLGRELAALYGACREGLPSPLPELPVQYRDFARWQRQWPAEVLAAESAYWTGQLRGAPLVLELPADRPRPAVQTLRGGAASLLLPGELEQSLLRLGRRQGATLFMTLLAGFLALLQRYTGADDLVVGSPIANRNRGETEDLIGFFVNMLVLRTDLSGEPGARELLTRVRETALSAYAHQDLPFEKLVEELKPERDPSRNPVFQVSFQLLNTRTAVPDLAGLAVEAWERDHGTAKFDLELTLAETPGGLTCFVEYSSDLFEAATAERLLGHYRRLLSALAVSPGLPVSELPLLDAEEERQLIVGWNDTARDYGEASTLHELIAEQARRTPEATAVLYEGRGLTYLELEARANQLAHHLRARGVGPEILVGLCLERSLEMVVGLLAVLKAGGAYVPLDPGYPEERLAFMLEDSRTPVLLTQGRLAERLARLSPQGGPELLALDLLAGVLAQEPETAPEPLAGPDHPAYAIYTSGSTGRPKGAVNTHRAILNRLLWMQEAYGLNAEDRVLQKTPFSFDVSVWEFFWPLMVGARLVVARPGGHQESGYLVEVIEREAITTVHFVPSMLQVFLTEPDLERCGSLRRVIASGEALPFDLKERFFARLPNTELHNLYGPTEAAVDVTAWPCAPGGEGPLVPIGQPIANVRVHVLDRGLRPVPVGVPGELFLAGVQLARGYLGRPELTAERFVPDPLGGPGERLYRTGDLVRRLSDGTLVYLGRLDHQVKLRGLRIELGEIEAALDSHPGIRQSAVLVREDRPGDRRLVAYGVPAYQPAPEVSELREHLRSRLPDYMVPSSFVLLGELPLTPNGKVDRKALPAPERPTLQGDYQAPRTATEETLARIWAGVLGLDRVGITDNFFDLGGHSLLALHVINHIRTHFGLDLPLGTMFRSSTVEKMAALVEGQTTPSTSPLVLLGGWSSDRTPFFCVHGVGGNVFRFVQLARPSRRPFYGIQGWSDLDDIGHLDSVPGMAERYMAEIRKIQPRGPYFLGGVCLGCMVAFEMARRFEAEGETVAFVGFFDTSASNLPPEVLDTFSFEAGIANELGIAVSYEEMGRLPREEHLGYVIEEGRRQGILPTGFTLTDARRYIEVFRLNLTAFLRYHPAPSGVGATLFATASDDVPGDPTWGWGDVALKGVEVVDIPGDNASMLRPPHVEVFTQRLDAALDAAEARALSPAGTGARRRAG